MLNACFRSFRKIPNTDVSCKIFLCDLFISLELSEIIEACSYALHYLYFIWWNTFVLYYWFIVSYQASIILVDLHASIFLLSFALYIGVAIGIYSFFMLSQCIKQNLQLSCFPFLRLFYPTHYFTLGIVFFMCVGYRIGR